LPHFFSFRVKSSNAVAAAASKEEEEEDIHKNNGRKGKTIFQHVHLRGIAMFLGDNQCLMFVYTFSLLSTIRCTRNLILQNSIKLLSTAATFPKCHLLRAVAAIHPNQPTH
jgi:hypothetical protein